MTLEEYDKALKRYKDTFGEPFPLYMAPGDDDLAVKLIIDCVESGKAYDPKTGPDILY